MDSDMVRNDMKETLRGDDIQEEQRPEIEEQK